MIMCVRRWGVGALGALCVASCASVAQNTYVTPPPTETVVERVPRYAAWRAANPGADARAARAADQARALIAARGISGGAVEAPAEILRTADTGATLWDCAMCPEMVITPAGNYTIGSQDAEPGRAPDEG